MNCREARRLMHDLLDGGIVESKSRIKQQTGSLLRVIVLAHAKDIAVRTRDWCRQLDVVQRPVCLGLDTQQRQGDG